MSQFDMMVGGKTRAGILNEYPHIKDFVVSFMFNAEHDFEMPGFMQAVLQNDLALAGALADANNRKNLGYIAEFMAQYGMAIARKYGVKA